VSELPRLLVLNPTEITRDPRARRQLAAARQSWDTVGLCARLSGHEPLPVEGVVIERVGHPTMAPRLRRIGFDGFRQMTPVERELRGIVRLVRLARLTFDLRRAAHALGRFDIVHANELETLPVGWLIARRLGARLVYDAHEIYASSEPDHPRIFTAVTSVLEAALARRATAVTTVSTPIAEELRSRLKLQATPSVILNCPDESEQPAERNGAAPLRAVYQGAMGVSRPLGDIFAAAAAAPSVHFTIRVAGADLGSLRRRAADLGIAGRVKIAEPVEPTKLVEALAGEHVGLIINRPVSRNDELVFPNKLFEYLMAGLAVVAPRLPGMTPLLEEEQVGATFVAGDPVALGETLEQLAAQPDRVAAMRKRARRLARGRYNARVQAELLRAVWDDALAQAPSGRAA
jgi:glycosyltransferase involved in cell wall biosynthesis